MDDPRYEVLRIAIRKIAWPMQWLQEYAEDHGLEIDGPAAVELANDPNYLKQLAQQAMADIAKIDPTGVNDRPHRQHVMTPKEIYEQRRSFVRGMCPSHRDYKEWCEAVDRLMPPLSPAQRTAPILCIFPKCTDGDLSHEAFKNCKRCSLIAAYKEDQP